MKKNKKIIILLPARYSSTRIKSKLLKNLNVDEIYKNDDPIGATMDARKKAGSMTSTVAAPKSK